MDEHNQKNGRAEAEFWRGKAFSFFTNSSCEYFPCHGGVLPEDFNCLFCYCPLYVLGERCGGNFVYTADGIKNCSSCAVPHRRENYGYITGRFAEISDAVRRAQREPARLEQAVFPPPENPEAGGKESKSKED